MVPSLGIMAQWFSVVTPNKPTSATCSYVLHLVDGFSCLSTDSTFQRSPWNLHHYLSISPLSLPINHLKHIAKLNTEKSCVRGNPFDALLWMEIVRRTANCLYVVYVV